MCIYADIYLFSIVCILTYNVHVLSSVELTPFTTYSVAVAALTSEGQGPDSPVETNMTFQGCEFNSYIISLAYTPSY